MKDSQEWFEVLGHVDQARGLTGTDVLCGPGRVGELGRLFDERGLRRVLVVCGRHVGANTAVIEPLREALGDRLVGIHDGTSPGKEIGTVYEGIERLREVGADAILGVGGGSSSDTARQMSVFASDGRSLESFRDAAMRGAMEPPQCREAPTPVALVPTALAGGDISNGGTIEVLASTESPSGRPIRTRGSVTPWLVMYDAEMYLSTPDEVLRNSAMNGFNKGIETIYWPRATPVSDACVMRGIRLMADAFEGFVERDPVAVGRVVIGSLLIQLRRSLSIIHAFGHSISRNSDIHQGVAHAVLTPHVLEFVFARTHGRRDLMAMALGLDPTGRSDRDVASEVIRGVARVRDTLRIPASWRELDAARLPDLSVVCAQVPDDPIMVNSPIDVTSAEAHEVLERGW